ncbi:MAG: DUF1801 domain-containing protein [Clostridiaceae bacterium]|nr:DUF1801 domain-containing protein [Clostridiaceae bacterium]
MKVNTIDEYIAQYDGEVKTILEKTRSAIRTAAPDAIEKITWRMPTFWQKENLVHFAAHKSHLGIYPGGEATAVFADKLTEYKISKGAIQFPYSKPIPYALIIDIVKWRLKQI